VAAPAWRGGPECGANCLRHWQQFQLGLADVELLLRPLLARDAWRAPMGGGGACTQRASGTSGFSITVRSKRCAASLAAAHFTQRRRRRHLLRPVHVRRLVHVNDDSCKSAQTHANARMQNRWRPSWNDGSRSDDCRRSASVKPRRRRPSSRPSPPHFCPRRGPAYLFFLENLECRGRKRR
jgi:hypothetical protein